MGTSRSFAQLGAKFNALAADVADMPKGQVTRSALITKSAVLASIGSVTVGMKLRGVGKKGGKLGARYNEYGTGGESSALVFATGPLQLLERDTKAGPRPRKRRKGRGKNRFVGPVAGYYHPGTQGKHPWAKGIEAAMPLIAREFDAAGVLLLRRHF